MKGIKSKIFKAARVKCCAKLIDWQKTVTSFIWISVNNCQGTYICIYQARTSQFDIQKHTGSAEKAKQMIMSIVHHASGVHVFPELSLFPQCLHKQLTASRDYLKTGHISFIQWKIF